MTEAEKPTQSNVNSDPNTAASAEDIRASANTADQGSTGQPPSDPSGDPTDLLPEDPVSIEQQLVQALTRAKTWEEEYLRARADMENLRKRSAQEVVNAGKYAIESFAEAMVPVADSLEMALTLENQTLEGLKSGVELTLKQLLQGFQKGKLEAINPVGEKFDPNRHQAVAMVDGSTQTPPVAPNHVVQVMQKGYLVADRVLRPAIVVVAQ
jgi:molecular chaperone GrpE